jgi:hypothetical protein
MGIEQGIERGRDRERQSIAINVLQENIPLETIARITELMIDRLQQIQFENGNDRAIATVTIE